LGYRAQKLLPEVISVILSRYITLATPTT